MNDIFFGITDTGRIRENNEDAFIATQFDERIVACVIDGVGGYAGGERASAITRETVLDYFDHHDPRKGLDLNGILQEASNRIFEEKQKSPLLQQMACVVTLAVADIPHNQFYYVHVGDTRLYLFRDGSLVKITKDHSFVGFLEDNGRLTEHQAMNHPKRNEINKALGFGQAQLKFDYPEMGQSPFLPGDLLLLCSDGLTDLVSREEIVDILLRDNALAQKGKELVKLANQKGGKDNITVVLVKNNKSPVTPEATLPNPVAQEGPDASSAEAEVQSEDVQEETGNSSSFRETKNYRMLLVFFGVLSLVLLIILLLQSKATKDEKLLPADELKVSPADSVFNKDSLILVDTSRVVQ